MNVEATDETQKQLQHTIDTQKNSMTQFRAIIDQKDAKIRELEDMIKKSQSIENIA